MKRVLSTILFVTTFLPSSLLAVNLHICTDCHGKHFEKSAMGLSRIVKDLTKEDLEEALQGYKKGTMGGTMKDVMSGQISKFTDEEISQISEEITDNNITNITVEVVKDENQTIEVELGICASCHGENFEKTAMGFSRIVAEMSEADIKASLHGYKDGTYGRDKQALMVNQIIHFSEEEIDAIAEQIFEGYHYE